MTKARCAASDWPHKSNLKALIGWVADGSRHETDL